MKRSALPIARCLKEMSSSELKVYLHILERVDQPHPYKFEINVMDLCRDCDISIPTAKNAIEKLVNKGNLILIGRR